jgi:hypothetical protein
MEGTSLRQGNFKVKKKLKIKKNRKSVEAMNILKYNTKRIPWLKEEDDIIVNELKEKGHISFHHLIDKYRYQFHPSRTVRSLEAHFYRLKRSGIYDEFEKAANLEKKNNSDPTRDEGVEDIDEISDQVIEKKISTKLTKSEVLKEKRESKQAIKLEKEHFMNPLPVSSTENPVFADLSGDKLVYPITKFISFIGRKGKKNNCQIDIDLTKIGSSALQTSKQQASIELQLTQDGSYQFILKNLGKKSIFVNDFEVNENCEKYIYHQNLISFSSATRSAESKKLLFSVHKTEIDDLISKHSKSKVEEAPPSQILIQPSENEK